MNKLCYRLIFSRTHGELRVVSELARSCGSETGQRRGPGAPRLWVTVRRVVWMLGLMLYAETAAANGIVADIGAAPGLRPEVIATQNGLPQVNITAPNQAGVSHNHYQQFDVNQNGAILNNSAVMTSTQLAGMIQGNPNLNPNTAPAQIILNEVNSTDPSQLRGFLEVAGGRAQVIIANPSGIVCNGCGTINAGRMTLTTGRPQLNVDGSLAGYQVERGVVRIEGGGINGDARHDTDYVDILARAVEINAQVRAKEGLSVIAGRNRISADGKAITPLAADGEPPTLAIDMGQMGGMYSGHIQMIATEAGVGVRNQGGHIQAHKTLMVNSEGRLSWQSGTAQEAFTQADGDMVLAAKDSIEYNGKLHSGGTLSVHSREGGISQSGTMAAADDVRLLAAGGIQSSGHLLAGSNIDSSLTREADLTLSSQGEIRASGSLLSKKDINVSGRGIDLSQAKLKANRGTFEAKAGGVALRQAHIDSGLLAIDAAGDIDARQAQVRAGRWDVSADNLFNQNAVWSQSGIEESRFTLSGMLDNTDANVTTHRLNLDTNSLTNLRGTLTALDTADQRWRVSGPLNNNDGKLVSNANLTLETGNLENKAGLVQSKGNLSVTVGKAINNAQGKLLSGGQMALDTAGDVINQSGVLSSQQALTWQGGASSLFNNDAGSLQSGGALSLRGGELTNRQQGVILSQQSLTLDLTGIWGNQSGTLTAKGPALVRAAGLNNAQGVIQSLDSLDMRFSRALDNGNGRIFSQLAQSLQAQDIINIKGWMGSQQGWTAAGDRFDNREGDVQSQHDSRLLVNTLDNAKGSLTSGAGLALRVAQGIDNRAGRISALGRLDSQGAADGAATGHINNAKGQWKAGDTLTLTAQSLNNTQGGLLESQQKMLKLNLSEALDNRQGTLRGEEALQIDASRLLNEHGTIESRQQLALRIGDVLDNTRGAVRSTGLQQITAGQVDNRYGVFSSQGGLSLDASRLDNLNGSLISQGSGVYRLDVLNNRQGKIHGGDTLTLAGSLVNNQAGELISNGSFVVNATQLDNSGQGKITSQERLEIQSERLNNRDGGLLLGTTHTDVNAQTFDNTAGRLHSAGSLTLSNLKVLDNRQGGILANGQLNLNADDAAGASALALLNQGGTIESGETLNIKTGSLDNHGGSLRSQRALTLSMRQDYTHRAGDTLHSNSAIALSMTGMLTNLTDWSLPGSLDVNSSHITNHGLLSGGALELTTGTLLNQGRLEADRMSLNVDTLDNVALIVGDDINVRGRIIDNHGREAVIAATEALRLQAGERLTNREGAYLYSGDSLHLASDDLIENRASAIEAEGNVRVEAKRLDNLREGLEIARDAETSAYKWHRYNYYWRSFGSKKNPDKSAMAPTTQLLTFQNDDAAQNNPYGTLLKIDANAKRAQVRIFGDLGLSTDLWVNYLALKPGADNGYDMTFYETRGHRQKTAPTNPLFQTAKDSPQNIVPTPYHNTVWREHTEGHIEQWDPEKHINIAAAPSVTDYNNLRERTATGTTTRDHVISEGIGAVILAGGDMKLHLTGQLLNDASQIEANGDLISDGGGQIENISYSVNERRQETLVDHYDKDMEHWYPTARSDETTALNSIDGIITGNGNVLIRGVSIANNTVNQAQISTVEAAQKAAHAEQVEWEQNPLAWTGVDWRADTLSALDHPAAQTSGRPLLLAELALTENQHVNSVATSIPNNGLFRQQPAPDSPYVVVTDKRFTSCGKFISSDYMLARLGYDPSKVHKRLSDGFYEQRLVREQVMKLTGRPSVRGENAMAQYQALMENGIKTAQDIHLVPGVALTPAQIAALQQDIVWLVSETVETAYGRQTVWAPKVYLAKNTLRLTGDGSLIGGGTLRLSADSIINAGSLFSDKALVIDAGQFAHRSGDIRADRINVQADALTLSTSLQNALRQALMSANDISLSGNSILLEGARLDAARDISLSAQNNLNITSAKSSHIADLNVISGAMGNRTHAGMEEAGKRMALISGEWQQAQGSTLNAGGNIRLNAGQDMTLQGSQISADGQLGVHAAGNVALQAQTTTNRTHLRAGSRTSTVNNHRQDDNLVLSTLSGAEGVTLAAGNSLLAEGTQVDSQRGSINLRAQEVTINEARRQTADQDSERTGFFEKNNSREVETSRSEAVGSTFSGRSDITALAHEENVTVTGSILHSEQGLIALQAKKDVNIYSATEHETHFMEERSSKSSGFSKSSSHTEQDDRVTRKKGSLLSGDRVSVTAGNDLAVSGSAIVADRNVNLRAGNNIDITAATETESHYLLEEKKKSGLTGSGGIGFSVGSQSSRHQVDENGTTQSQSFSTVGSNQGNVNIVADNGIHISGADLLAGRDLILTGDSVQIDPGYDQRTREESFESKQSGLTLALSGSVGSALNTAVSTAQQARKESDGRLGALQGVKAALSGVQAAQAQEQINQSGADQSSGIAVSISVGCQKSSSKQRQEQRAATGSTLSAGNNLSVTASGKKRRSK
ncbi:filamentous hemagglutinin N-terminal domain-containing protein [Acerihabitans sp. KWT182]|uniref:Filamentous hemagglutinin N-terminal domain-containing protein n=1 Tax=Acerihabitans sp. KWT182 TaxID=3157919 RepID=A0AAU7Q953_9GAMM